MCLHPPPARDPAAAFSRLARTRGLSGWAALWTPSGHTETMLQPFISSPCPPPTPAHIGASPHAPPLSPGPSAIPRIPP